MTTTRHGGDKATYDTPTGGSKWPTASVPREALVTDSEWILSGLDNAEPQRKEPGRGSKTNVATKNHTATAGAFWQAKRCGDDLPRQRAPTDVDGSPQSRRTCETRVRLGASRNRTGPPRMKSGVGKKKQRHDSDARHSFESGKITGKIKRT